MNQERRILKSWKQIATYLGVGIRTAQRWKQEHNLPVRQPGATRAGAVLALTDEIDRWLQSSSHIVPRRERDRPLADIVITDDLWGRPSRPRNLEREIDALLDLGRAMASDDRNAILSKISSCALELCKAESAGFSILETAESGPEVFRWTATSGRMRGFEGGTTPAEFSPCGVCLERNSPQLFRFPETYYSYLAPISPISELMLIPMHEKNDWVGTIWVISHTKRRRFDREDARLMMNFGRLASAAVMAGRSQGSRPKTEPADRPVRTQTSEPAHVATTTPQRWSAS